VASHQVYAVEAAHSASFRVDFDLHAQVCQQVVVQQIGNRQDTADDNHDSANVGLCFPLFRHIIDEPDTRVDHDDVPEYEEEQFQELVHVEERKRVLSHLYPSKVQIDYNYST
jgi:hypothetical protein